MSLLCKQWEVFRSFMTSYSTFWW